MKSKKILFFFLQAVLMFAIFFSTLYYVQLRPVSNYYVNQYAVSDVVYTDGSTAHFDKLDFGTVNRGDVVTVHLYLPQRPLRKNPTLCFNIYHSVTEVWCNGTLLDSYGGDINAKGDFVGDKFFMIPLPDEAMGGEVTIIFKATENNAFSQVKNLELYSARDAYQYIIDGDPVSFLISFPMFIFGCISMLVLLCGGKYNHHRRKGFYLAVFASLISLWLLGTNGVPVIFGFGGYFLSIMEFLGAFTAVIPLLLYACTSTKRGWLHYTLGVAAVVNAVFFIVATILNFTNVVHYSETLIYSNILTFGSGIFLIIFAIHMNIRGKRADSIFFTGMSFMFFTGIYELFRLNGRKYLECMQDIFLPCVLPLGISAFIVYAVVSYLSESRDYEREYLLAQFETVNLNKTMEDIPAGICRIVPDENLTIIAANNILYHIIGYTDEEIKNKTEKSINEKLSEDEKTFFTKKVKEILCSDKTVGEFEFSSASGHNSHLIFLIKYTYNVENDFSITANVIDITDRKRMEDELRIHSDEYLLAVEASDHLYFNYDVVTQTCTHLFDSDELFGISQELENIPEALVELGVCAPESVEEYKKMFRMFNEGIPKGDFILRLQNVKTHIYRWYKGSYRTVFDSNGAPLHAIVAFKDVTEQREKEISYNIHKQKIEAHPEDEINYFEVNLTTGICSYFYGTQAKEAVKSTSSNWDEVLNYATHHFVSPKYKKAIQELLNIKQLLKIYSHGVTEVSRDYRGFIPDGEARWINISVSMIADEHTHEVRAFCTTQDIEEEKAKELEQELELQRSRYYEDAYEKLASAVMYGVCKYSADENLSIIFANDTFYEMHGYSSQQEAIDAGFTSILFAIPPFGKDLVLAAHREYASKKTDQIFETEYPTIDASGNRIWILCRGIYSPSEGIFNASVLNITDRKKTEEKLRVSEERYRLALSQSGKVFFFFDVPTRTMHLSDELAQLFGLPNKVDNMPDNFIAQGLVEPESVDNYRGFYEDIFSGEPSGSTIISCHMRGSSEVLWYRIAFTSVFDAKGAPQSSVITYEDLQEERANKIAGAWKQLNLVSLPESKYVVAEYNLTRNLLIHQEGGLFAAFPDSLTGYDEIGTMVLENFIYSDDVEIYKAFLNRNRLLTMFEQGKTEDSIEYRSLQSGSSPRWTSTSVQMIKDSYSDDIFAQLLIMDIHAEKSGQIEMAQNFEELKKELENSRIKVMINQMQPHFLYNALSAIQTIVKIDPDYAYRLIYDFTVHLRSSIKALSSDAPIPFTDELNNIKAYLNIEQMRFGECLKVKYEIECDDFSVIPLSIQPLAENAARHGVYPKGDDGGTVTVRTKEAEYSYVVEVEDDGVGFDFNEVLERGGDSVGLKSLIFRLKSLMNADVIINSKLGVGTKVTVIIPKKED